MQQTSCWPASLHRQSFKEISAKRHFCVSNKKKRGSLNYLREQVPKQQEASVSEISEISTKSQVSLKEENDHGFDTTSLCRPYKIIKEACFYMILLKGLKLQIYASYREIPWKCFVSSMKEVCIILNFLAAYTKI